MRTRAAGLVLIALLSGGVGCSGSSEAEPVPDGFRAFDGSGFALAIPQGWERTSGDERLNPEVDAEFVPTDDDRDTPTQIVVAATRARPGQTSDAYATFIFGVGQFEATDAEITDKGPIEVTGADDAVRLEFNYLEDRVREPVEIRSWSVVARAGGRFYDLRMSSPEEDFDEELFEQVIETFEVGQ